MTATFETSRRARETLTADAKTLHLVEFSEERADTELLRPRNKAVAYWAREQRKESHSIPATPPDRTQIGKCQQGENDETKLSSITRRLFCRGLGAMAVLPLAVRCGAMAQTHPGPSVCTPRRRSGRKLQA